MLKMFNKKKGFTLIELLVVIAIIGLLSSIVLVSMGGTRKRARDARRQADLQSIMTAMEICYGDSACATQQDIYPIWTSNATTAISVDIDKNPALVADVEDPLNSGDYYYTVLANNTGQSGQYYCIYARLESFTNATYFCVSNKGSAQIESATVPTNADCCGPNVTL